MVVFLKSVGDQVFALFSLWIVRITVDCVLFIRVHSKKCWLCDQAVVLQDVFLMAL